MSTFSCPIVRIGVESHPDADKLDIIQIQGTEYQCVAQKGNWKPGDVAIYIPEGAILPDNIIEEMGLAGLLAGSKKNRVKAIRLRGVLSQGLVYPIPDAMEAWLGGDVSQKLGITKYEPEIPAQFNGQWIPATTIKRYTEIENAKMYPDMFLPFDEVVVTEKIHGTCAIYHYPEGGEFKVSSKGLAKKSVAIEEDQKNIYWQIAHEYNIEAIIRNAILEVPYYFYKGIMPNITFYGEIFGPGVQDLTYGLNKKAFRMFDVRIGDRFLSYGALHRFCDVTRLPVVPHLFVGPFSEAKRLGFFGVGASDLAPTQMREGVVVRQNVDDYYEPYARNSERKIAKFINPDYLTRKGGTEYE